MKFEDSLRHKELDDFLDVKEVEGWKSPKNWEVWLSFAFLLGFIGAVSLILVVV